MRIFLFILTFFSAFSVSVFSQNYDLGEVTKEELLEKVHPKDTAAAAAILFKKAKSKFNFFADWSVETTVNYKIKIYKKEGLTQADIKVPFYTGGNQYEEVTFSNAITYNLEGGKIVKTKLTSDGEFKEILNKSWGQKKILLPNVKVGSIIEYSYKHTTRSLLKDFRFQSTIPTNYVEYSAFIPDMLVFNTTITGYEKINVATSTTSTSKILEKKHVYTGYDIPPLQSEGYVNNINNYISAIKFDLAVIKSETRPDVKVNPSWEGLTKEIYKSQYFGNELSKNGYFEEDLKAILKDIVNRDDKIKAILKYLKSKVIWNKYGGFMTDLGVKKAYKESEGNAADINLMLVAMLRSSGIDANPILISTRENGVSWVPRFDSFDYVIAGVEIQNDIILLDATDKYSSLNILPIRDINWLGRIVRENNSSAEVDLFPKILSSDVVNIIATITQDGVIEAKVKHQYFDYNAYVFRDKFATNTTSEYIEKLEEKHKNIEVSDYEIEGKTDVDQPLIERYSFKDNRSVEFVSNKIMISPLMFFATEENPFKLENRKYPIDFAYPNQDRFLINITIPDGYEVEYLPKSISIPMSDNLLIDSKYLISNSGNKIQLSYIKNINTSIIAPEYYEELKAVFNEIIKKETEKIVLKKI